MRKALAVILMVVLTAGCSEIKRPSHGEFNQLTVFSSDEVWAEVAEQFKATYEKPIITPQAETMYKVYRVPDESFGSFQYRRFIFFVDVLENMTNTESLFGQFITPDIEASVRAGNYLYVRENEWANRQVVVFLLAPTVEELESALSEKEEMLYRIINDSRNRYREFLMFEKKEQREISEQLFAEHNFTLRVQHDYHLVKNDPEQKYVWLRRFDPDRMLLIHWVDTTGVESISEDWAIAKREHIGLNFEDNALVHEDYTTIAQEPFQEYLATVMRGLWIKRDDGLGGPFVNFTFFDDKTERIYMIDLMVFAPEFPKEKEPFIRALEIMASTFTTVRPTYLQE